MALTPRPRAARRALLAALSFACAAPSCDSQREVSPLTPVGGAGGGLAGGGLAGGGLGGGAGGGDAFGPEGPLGPRPPVQTCALPAPPPPARVSLEPVAGLRVPGVVSAVTARGGAGGAGELLAGDREGRLWAWPLDERGAEGAGAAPRALGALPVSADGGRGLLALALSPRFAQDRALFALYASSRCPRSGAPRCVRLGRWALGEGLALDAGAEVSLLEAPQPGPDRPGGGLAFGGDGTLYVALGDGGVAPLEGEAADGALAPAPGALRGAVLRLDVSAPDPDCGLPYSVPSTNPFAGNRCVARGGAGWDAGGGRPELWAWGLRDPAHLSLDAPSGALLVTDAGARRDEVSRVVGGAHHGWPAVEGDACAAPGCAPEGYAPPFVTLARGAEAPGAPAAPALVGGFVYRGAAHPTLAGYYLYADRPARRLVAVPPSAPQRAQVLVEGVDLAALSVDAESEPLLWSAEGEARRLVSRGDEPGAVVFPQLLSLTGCFSDTPRALLARSVVPYEVNRPFWSDRAEKERALALPAGAEIGYAPAGESLSLPEGAVIIKTFYITDRAGQRRRYETRLLHHSARGWVGYTYRWREDLSDADLLLNGYDETLEGPVGPQRWSFLDPSACDECHTPAAGFTLGLSVEQLNLTRTYEGGALNQLDALARAGYLRLPAPAAELPRLSRGGDPAISVERDARELLHVNCAYCHLPGALTHLSLDLRLTTPFSEMGLCDVPPTLGDIVVPDARLVAPGDPDRSVLLLRARTRGFGKMPPLSSHMEDFEGAATLALWISQLTGCDP